MRRAPSPLLIEAVVKGASKIVPGFDTTLHGGVAVPCLVFYGSQVLSEPNPFADLLWLQALIRKEGLTRIQTPSPILGSVVMLFGDPSFMEALTI